MKRYDLRAGDPCPLCGQPIQTEDEEQLRLLSVIAAFCGRYEWPEEDT